MDKLDRPCPHCAQKQEYIDYLLRFIEWQRQSALAAAQRASAIPPPPPFILAGLCAALGALLFS